MECLGDFFSEDEDESEDESEDFLHEVDALALVESELSHDFLPKVSGLQQPLQFLRYFLILLSEVLQVSEQVVHVHDPHEVDEEEGQELELELQLQLQLELELQGHLGQLEDELEQDVVVQPELLELVEEQSELLDELLEDDVSEHLQDDGIFI